jgi:hypothetical protein
MGPVIVHLVGQHQAMTVTSGPDGPLYTAKTADGQPIVANATLQQLREQHPEVYRFVEPTMAVRADTDGVVPDQAGLPDAGGPAQSGEPSDRLMLLHSRE